MNTRIQRRKIEGRPVHRGGFTLIELILVIALLGLVVLVAMPAFSGLMRSASEGGAENALRSGLAAGRDAAVRSSGINDGAAVFFFEPGGRLTIVPCVRVGAVKDWRANSTGLGGALVWRDGFVPVPEVDPIQLPLNWMIRAYAAPETVDDQWYDDNYQPMRDEGNWVFPETGFYDRSVDQDGDDRQSFMVRFQAGTGRLRIHNGEPALVLSLRPTSILDRPNDWKDPTKAEDLGRWVQRVLNDSSLVRPGDRAELLGNESGDTVLVRSVSLLAVYDIKRLAAAIGMRGINPKTGSLYGDGRGIGGDFPTDPTLDSAMLGGLNESDVISRVNDWIEGRQGGPLADVPSDVRLFTVPRYAGQVQEIAP